MSCTICENRMEKRFCPAIHSRICPQCCGTERENTLDCPRECVYLQQARRNEKPRALAQLDQSELMSHVEINERFIREREPLLLGLTFSVAQISRSDPTINDRDVLGALLSLAKTYDTLVSSGLHYTAPATNPIQNAISSNVQKMVAQFRALEEKELGYTNLKDSEVLRAIVFMLRTAQMRTSGRPKSRAFLDFLGKQFPAKEKSVVAPMEEESRIILP